MIAALPPATRMAPPEPPGRGLTSLELVVVPFRTSKWRPSAPRPARFPVKTEEETSSCPELQMAPPPPPGSPSGSSKDVPGRPSPATLFTNATRTTVSAPRLCTPAPSPPGGAIPSRTVRSERPRPAPCCTSKTRSATPAMTVAAMPRPAICTVPAGPVSKSPERFPSSPPAPPARYSPASSWMRSSPDPGVQLSVGGVAASKRAAKTASRREQSPSSAVTSAVVVTGIVAAWAAEAAAPRATRETRRLRSARMPATLSRAAGGAHLDLRPV